MTVEVVPCPLLREASVRRTADKHHHCRAGNLRSQFISSPDGSPEAAAGAVPE